MPSIVFVRGGPYHDAAGVPLSWEISKQPGLDDDGPYVFFPGVPVEVSARDAAWLMDPNNTRERVFELVGKRPHGAAAPAAPATPPSSPTPADPADGVDSTKGQEARAQTTPAPSTGGPTEHVAGKPGPQTGPSRT